MQLSKFFSGALPDVGTTASRQCSYGVEATITSYPSKVDFINQTIADFLRDECGVDAVYEERGASNGKFLWIFNAPFLFAPPKSNSNYISFYGPYNAAVLQAGSTSASSASYSMLFQAAASGVYSFTLLFTGNPQTGFALRLKGNNATAIGSAFCFRFIKASNILNGKESVVWIYGNTVTNTIVSNANGLDLSADGLPDPDSFSTSLITYLPTLSAKLVNKTSALGKFPLVPLLFGIWKPTGIYCNVRDFALPAATNTEQEMQCEIEISGRRFINTTSENVATNYINLGLIEVND